MKESTFLELVPLSKRNRLNFWNLCPRIRHISIELTLTMHFSILLLATLFVLPQSLAQQSPDGRIVPFKSSLPSCASQCGPLYDVEGGCKDKTCFCADPRLQAFRQVGNAGASSICGAASCTAATDLEALKTWYNSFCGSTAPEPTATTTGSGAVSTKGSAAASGNSGGGSDTWYVFLHCPYL